MKDDLMTPLRWSSDQSDNWYITKMKDSSNWIEIYNHKVVLTLKEISMDTDENGFPVVILQKIGFNQSTKLTQGLKFDGYFFDFKINLTGYWIKNRSIVSFSNTKIDRFCLIFLKMPFNFGFCF